MRLTPGSRLGPYTIVDQLGAGGMGEVYRARDSRLGRTVAIKVLPPSLSSEPEARHRLQREARTLSQLTHPNICALYDVGEEGDADYLVMEMIEGETLAARLARGPLAIDEVLTVGAQIAAALDHAHRSGIAHRDLKPGNVMLTASGAKLLDFGLAKLVAATPAVAPDGSTVRQDLTSSGTVLGTFQYMAPEQIEGRPADARSDIFALGAVLFEMATGRRAFQGESLHAMAGAILTVTPPPVSSLQPAAPAALDRLVAVCLDRSPDKRWQSAHDVAVLLGAANFASGTEASATPQRRTPAAVRWLPWGLAVAALAWSLVLWQRPAASSVVSGAPVTFTVPPPPGSNFLSWVEGTELALSPDGTRLAFIVSTGGIWIRPLASLSAAPLAGAENATGVFWSPDGRSIGFFRAGVLNRIDAAGGPVVPLCSVLKGTGHTGTWGSDGIVFAPITGAAISLVPTAGGAAVEVVKPDPARHETRLIHPHYLPDGRRFLYTAWHDDRTARLMIWERDRAPREIMTVMSNVEYVEPGFLLFVRDGTLVALRFDTATATVSGDPVAVTQPVAYMLMPGTGHFTSSRNGVLAYQSHSDQARVAWFDRTGREVSTALKTAKYLSIRLTPDGRSLLFDRGTTGTGTFDLWMLDLARGIETRVTSDAGNEINSMLTPDRSALVYSAGPFSAPRIRVRDLATGSEHALQDGPIAALQQAEDVTPDRQSLLFTERRTGTFELLISPLRGGAATPVLDPGVSSLGARFSPDGTWLAFNSDESGSPEIYVARWPGARDRVRVSTSGGQFPRWAQDGRELFYLSSAGLMSVPVSRDQPGSSRLLLDTAKSGAWSDFDVAPDGRFVAIVAESVGAQQPLTVVVNWRPR